MQRRLTVPIVVSENDVLRRIGSGTARKVSRRTRGNVRHALQLLVDCARPRAVWKMVPIRKEDGSVLLEGGRAIESRAIADALAPCSKAALFVTTLGRAVDRRIYMVRDAVGAGETVTERFSPGQWDWPLEEQRKIFEMLPSKPAGVCLSTPCRMVPSKSVLGIVGIGPLRVLPRAGNVFRARPSSDQEPENTRRSASASEAGVERTAFRGA
jgi:hypothetical protein